MFYLDINIQQEGNVDPALKLDLYIFLLIFIHTWMFLSTMQTLPNQIPLGPAEMISLLSFSIEWGFYSCWISTFLFLRIPVCGVFGLLSLRYINLLAGLEGKCWLIVKPWLSMSASVDCSSIMLMLKSTWQGLCK